MLALQVVEVGPVDDPVSTACEIRSPMRLTLFKMAFMVAGS